jgi:hypothetical protein
MTVPCAVWEIIKGTGTTGTRHEMGKKKPTIWVAHSGTNTNL